MNILLGITGSVAAIKIVELVYELSKLGQVKVVVTESAFKIINKTKGCDVWNGTLRTVDSDNKLDDINVCQLIRDEDEWKWETIGDPVLHIDLKDWADVLVIAPLTANTLAKMANGIADNLTSCICRAWPAPKYTQFGSLTNPLGKLGKCVGGKPIVIAPAMNTDMWGHPHTNDALKTLWGFYGGNLSLVRPVEKKLACGVTGIGAMADIKDIAEAVKRSYDKVVKKEETET